MTPRAIRLVLVAALLLLGGGAATLGAESPVIRGSLSDVLASAFVNFVIQSFRPLPPRQAALLALGAASLLELGQYFHLATRLGFKPCSLPAILLGNTYSLPDLGLYGIGCAGAVWVERRLPAHSRA
ncbi:MAG: DUF2809 domain-containing protein [Holophagaceae bacterium]